jgi:hypothetical protein
MDRKAYLAHWPNNEDIVRVGAILKMMEAGNSGLMGYLDTASRIFVFVYQILSSLHAGMNIASAHINVRRAIVRLELSSSTTTRIVLLEDVVGQ